MCTDGLGSFSIFLELTKTRPDPDMQAILGPTVALGKTTRFQVVRFGDSGR